jgi:hypothetical protein
MWSAAVLEPAFPGLRRVATGSPVPPGPWSTKAVQRVMAVGLLPGRGRVLLVGVGDHEDAVEVDDDLTVGVRGVPAGQRPDSVADFGACGPDGLQGFLAGRGEGVDQAGDGRVGGDRAEDGRLTPQHGDVREAVPAQCDRQGDVQEDLAGIVDGPRLPPRSQSCRYSLVKARLADRLQQQDRTGLRDHLPTVSLDTDTWVRRDRLSHLESALFLAANRTLSKSYRCRSRALSVFLISSWTAHLVKARG